MRRAFCVPIQGPSSAPSAHALPAAIPRHPGACREELAERSLHRQTGCWIAARIASQSRRRSVGYSPSVSTTKRSPRAVKRASAECLTALCPSGTIAGLILSRTVSVRRERVLARVAAEIGAGSLLHTDMRPTGEAPQVAMIGRPVRPPVTVDVIKIQTRLHHGKHPDLPEIHTRPEYYSFRSHR